MADKTGSNWDESQYRQAFRALGYADTGMWKVMKHSTTAVPSMYFNRSASGRISFVVHSKDFAFFQPDLWKVIGPEKSKDDKPDLMTLVPVAGSEVQAFQSLLAPR